VRIGRASLLGLCLAWAGGCTSLDRARPTGWTCAKEIEEGDLSASSIRFLYSKGRQHRMVDIWSWGGRLDGVWWSFYEKRESERRPPVLSISLQSSKAVHRRTIAAEFSLQDGTRKVAAQLDPGIGTGFNIRASSEMLIDLGRDGPVVISGFDRSGAVTFRSQVDVDLIRKGSRFMAEARQGVAEMVRDYQKACQGDYPYMDMVIT